MELHLGIMTNDELAEWFEMKPSSFRSGKKTKLKELSQYAKFEEIAGKVNIKEIYDPIYSKDKHKIQSIIQSKINETWSETGLDSCRRVSDKIYSQISDTVEIAPRTAYNYTRIGRNNLYGKPFEGGGPLGYCEYLLCKKLYDENNEEVLAYFTPEETVIKDEMIKKYFGNTTEKNLVVKNMVARGEITKEEAWEVLEQLTGITDSKYLLFLRDLESALGCQIIRGTQVYRISAGDKKSAQSTPEPSFWDE